MDVITGPTDGLSYTGLFVQELVRINSYMPNRSAFSEDKESKVKDHHLLGIGPADDPIQQRSQEAGRERNVG